MNVLLRKHFSINMNTIKNAESQSCYWSNVQYIQASQPPKHIENHQHQCFVYHRARRVFCRFSGWEKKQSSIIYFLFNIKQTINEGVDATDRGLNRTFSTEACCVRREAASIFITKSSLPLAKYILIIHQWNVLIMHGASLAKEKSFQMPLANPSHHDGRHTGRLRPKESSLTHKDSYETNKHLLICCSYENTPKLFTLANWPFGFRPSLSLTLKWESLRRRTERSISCTICPEWKNRLLKDPIQAGRSIDCHRATAMNMWVKE